MAKNIDKMQFTNSKKRDNWEQIKLKDIAVKRNKKNKDSSISTVFSNSALNGIVEQKDFFAKKIANKDNLSSYFIVEKDDFVYNPRISSMAPCGPIHRNNTNKTGIVSPLYTVFRMDPKKCSLDYFEQYFKSSCWHKYMYSIANYGARSDRMNITDSDFFNMEIDAPQLIEQEKISSILTIWDKAIELKEKLIEQKKKQKKGLMQKLLTGEVRLPGFEGEWKKVRLGKIGKTYNGLSGKKAEDFGEGKPYIPYKAIFDNSKIYINKFEYVRIEENEKQNIVKYGDIFFTTSSETPDEVGMSSVLLEDVNEVYLNSFCFGYRLNNFDTLIPEFAQFLFRSDSFRRSTFKLAQGSTRFNISKNEMMKITVLLPSIEEQKAIAEVLSNADREIKLLKKQVNFLKEQKKGLMQLLLTGKVRVKV